MPRVQPYVTLERWLNLFALDLLFVMLVLLIVFMVITPLRPLEPWVDVPESTSAMKSPEYAAIDGFAWPADCPPQYGWLAGALVAATAALSGAVAIALRSRKQPSRPGCAGWFLFVTTVLALLVAAEAARPSCGWWY